MNKSEGFGVSSEPREEQFLGVHKLESIASEPTIRLGSIFILYLSKIYSTQIFFSL